MSLIRADARALPLVANCVQTCVTSPPYFGLRDYGNGGQIGLEPSPEAYVAALLTVFAEVWRVLKDDGTLWLNLGSSYFGAKGGDTHTGFNERYFGKQFAGDKQSRTPFPESDGKPAIPSRQRRRAPAYGSGGTVPLDSTGADFACSCLCDACRSDWLTHRDRIADSAQQTSRCGPLQTLTGRDTATSDRAEASPLASLPGALASNTLESWRQRRGACSRCDSRASALSLDRSSSGDALACDGMTWLNYTSKLKHKDMLPIPWMMAMALQAAGWYLRSDIIWSKPNPMPESVQDRPTKAHEYIFLLSKQERYYYDAKAIMVPALDEIGKSRGGSLARVGADPFISAEAHRGPPAVSNGYANKRSVWHVATQPYSGSHFATFPEDLITPCILAGSAPGDLVLDPFIGSGTVGTVCERFGRRWVGTDITYQHLSKDRTLQRGLRFYA